MKALTELRDGYTEANLKHEAFKRAHEAAKDELAAAAKGMMGLAQRGTMASAEDQEALAAMKLSLDRIEGDMQKMRDVADTYAWCIKNYYALANEGGPPVDWVIHSIEQPIWCGWTGHRIPGSWAVVDRELCRPELTIIGQMVRGKYGTAEMETLTMPEGMDFVHVYRIVVKYPAYRDMCWSDVDGQRILRALIPLTQARPAVDEVTAFLSSLNIEI